GSGASANRHHYVRLGEVHRSKYTALGLDLPLVECWLKLLHGELWMTPESEEPAGVYATFELARARVSDGDGGGDDAEPATPRGADREIGQPGRPLNILVADDTQANQEV